MLNSKRNLSFRALDAVFGVLCAMLLLGCRVGPGILSPQPPKMQEAYQATGYEVISSQEQTLGEWWRTFEDPVLNELIENAALRNLDVQEAAYRIAEARARFGVVRGGLFPQFDALASYRRRGISLNANEFVPPTRQFDFFSTGFDAS